MVYYSATVIQTTQWNVQSMTSIIAVYTAPFTWTKRKRHDKTVVPKWPCIQKRTKLNQCLIKTMLFVTVCMLCTNKSHLPSIERLCKLKNLQFRSMFEVIKPILR